MVAEMKYIGGKCGWLIGAALIAIAPGVLSAQSVAISPGYTTIGVNATLQYTATVTGLANTAVTWSVSGKVTGNATYGTITTGGLYTAPATIPANGITITALASDKKTSSTVYVNVAPAGPTITSIAPSPIPTGAYTITLTGVGFQKGATVSEGGVANITTTFVNSTTLTASYWHSATGPGTFLVMNTGTLWSAPFAVTWIASGPPPPQAIAPTTVSVNLGGTQQFTSANATSWSATAGIISTTGLYTAPAVMPASSKVTVKATGSGGTVSATVTLVNPNPQVIAPATVTLTLGATQQFTSTGATNWVATYGTVTSAGLYTAPSVWPASGADAVTVTGPNGNATATITLTPPMPVITSVGTNNQLPLGVFSTVVSGSGFTAQSTVSLGTTALTAKYSNGSINVSGFYGTSGSVSLVVNNGAVSSQPFPVQVGVLNAQVSTSAARRFLQQAAFGPSPADAALVQTLGFQGWLSQQFAMPAISNFNALAGSSQSGMPAVFLANAVTNPDQLRQKVAFALSQIFVTSITKVIWNQTMMPYQQMLLTDAFTNYRQILGDVTLSPAMGYYLDMANNAQANAAAGTAANENYAREVMQLMSIGTKVLNPNGTWPVDSNNLPIPTYAQADVTAMARIFTGWTNAPTTPGAAVNWGAFMNPNAPLVPYAPEHDTSAKTVMTYQAPAGLSATADLNGVLDYLALTHLNTAPFISKQLIQHLVKSNPSPAYVLRVSTAFTNSQGDMPTVITAILLDPEARANDAGGNDQPTDGHLQEPALLISGVVRAFGGQMTPANYYSSTLAGMGQDVYNAPSVFNYYSPGYVVG